MTCFTKAPAAECTNLNTIRVVFVKFLCLECEILPN